MNLKISALVISAVLRVLLIGHSQAQDVLRNQAGEHRYVSDITLEQSVFPLLHLMLTDSRVDMLLADEPTLREMTNARWSTVRSGRQRCVSNSVCVCETLRFTDEQIGIVSDVFRRLYVVEPGLRAFVEGRLSPKEIYASTPNAQSQDLLVQSWRGSALAINGIISTYCEGSAPRYPEIDSMAYISNSSAFAETISAIVDGLNTVPVHFPDTFAEELFFSPSLRFAVRLLQAHGRDEAARFSPIDSGENAAALQRLPKVDWTHFAYSVIVVPGEGPDLPDVRLSPLGKERARLGVAAFEEGKAPFILLSGGYVHPSRTVFCEALEMKRYIVETYQVPESVLLIDPYARHTTTNLRNAAREVLRHNLPTGLQMLVISDQKQISYIESAAFSNRNLRELHYQPVTLGKRTSPTSIEAKPSPQSLLSDPTDPLDP